MGIQQLCRWVGRKMLDLCARTGRVVNLFLETCALVRQADPKEVVRQMGKLGADSLPIVGMTILCTAWSCRFRQPRNLSALGRLTP